MTTTQNILISLSLAVWFLLIIFDFIRNRAQNRMAAGAQLLAILLVVFILHRYFNYFNTIEIKGDGLISEGWLLVGLYAFTILGILGHHIFAQIKGPDRPGRQARLKWLPFFKPLAISPIIFITFLSQLDKVGAQMTTLTAVSIQFGLAFQNGFFWKTIFDLLQDPQNK